MNPDARRRWRVAGAAVAGAALVAGGTTAGVLFSSSGATHPPRRAAVTTTTATPPTVAPSTSSTAPAGPAGWTVYHGGPLGSGVAPTGVSFNSPTAAWTSPALDGQLYGEPLEDAGRVVAATENDTVYALAANTGAVVWSTHLGTPVPASNLPCGDISPLVGITGTPVIDPSRHEVFVVADEVAGGDPAHHLYGLDLFTGKVELNQDVDPPGAQTAALLQRTGLAVDGGDVVFGMGGNYGDCGTYHGWVTAVPEAGGAVVRWDPDSGAGQRQGAVWMGGAAPEVDASGDIWVAVGNGSVDTSGAAYDGSDSVVELSAQLTVVQSFAPSDWPYDNAHDRDLGSTAPALLSDGTVLQVGKSQTAFLLRSSTLGGVGGQLTSAQVCAGADADGGDAVTGTVVYVPCRSGLEALHTSADPPSVTVAWTAASAPAGPPIVAGGLVWAIGGGSLYGINPSTGANAVHLGIGGEANHFPTPAVGDGLLLVPGGNGGDQVLAFAGSAGVPAAPTPAPAA